MYEFGDNLCKRSNTVPVEIRRQLGLKSGDKILFLQKQNGEIVVSNASAAAIMQCIMASIRSCAARSISNRCG